MQPYIQIQGFANERLSAVTYDISNALAVTTNLRGAVTGEFLDTNLLAFTTNYFQCYDVHLTNGLNLVTVHATDWAGNTTSTNLSYTLDYTGKTNPPVIAMTWPQGGEDIAQSNIMVYGTLSDPTSEISLQVTDTNGDVNMISGLVERDGHFWIQNVPLSPGTNWLSLIAQNMFGNTNLTTTTNLIVTENNSFGLTISPVTSDAWAAFSTVSGTIADSTYTVVVNGVVATNDGSGIWTAYDVPNNPGNMAVFQVNATNASGDPQGQWKYTKGAELTLQSAFYRDDVTEPPVDPSIDGTSETITSWSYTWGSGGTWTYTQILNSPPGYPDFISQSVAPIPSDGSLPLVVIFTDSLGSDQTNNWVPWEMSAPWIAAYPQEVGSLSVVNPKIADSSEDRIAGASWTLHVGHLDLPGNEPNLIVLFGTGKEEIPNANSGIIDNNGPALSGPEIINNGDQEDTNYNVYFTIPEDDEDINCPTASDCPLASVSTSVYQFKLNHVTECTAPEPAEPDPTRTYIGIGEVVIFGGMPGNTVWTLDGPGSLDGGNGTRGGGVIFRAAHSPGSATVHATVGDVNSSGLDFPTEFDVAAPTGISATVFTNVGLGSLGTNEIGAYTRFTVTIQPQTVSFNNNRFQETNVPTSYTIHWPSGDQIYGFDSGFDPGGCDSIFIDKISDGPFPIANLSNGTNYGSCSYTVNWNDQYMNDASNWVTFAPMQTTTTFNANGKTQQTYQNATGAAQGPWQ